MKKVQNFTPAECRRVSAAMEAALRGVADQLGVQFEFGSGRYGSKYFTVKVTTSVVNSDGVAETPERLAFKSEAQFYGMSADDLDREFVYTDGDRYKIVGLMPRSRKYPILCESADGKMMKFTASIVKMMLEHTHSDSVH